MGIRRRDKTGKRVERGKTGLKKEASLCKTSQVTLGRHPQSKERKQRILSRRVRP